MLRHVNLFAEARTHSTAAALVYLHGSVNSLDSSALLEFTKLECLKRGVIMRHERLSDEFDTRDDDPDEQDRIRHE